MIDGWVLQSGVVLFLDDHAAGVAFYRDTLKLPVIEDYADVVILGFGGGYLMLEREAGIARGEKSRAENPAVLRFNVADVDAMAAALRLRGVEIAVSRYDWGIVGRFRDPDGNPCELRNHYDGVFAGSA